MAIVIKQSNDAELIARLNYTVQELHHRQYPKYFKLYDYEAVRNTFTELLAKENWYAYVAYDDAFPIGYILFFIRDYEENPFRLSYKGIHIDQLCVVEEYQKRGIGSRLMEKAEEIGKNVKASQLELTFWEKNSDAKEFYIRKGFEEGMHFVMKKIE